MKKILLVATAAPSHRSRMGAAGAGAGRRAGAPCVPEIADVCDFDVVQLR